MRQTNNKRKGYEMEKLTIHCGYSQPLTAVGRHQCRLLGFAEKYPSWHSFADDRATTRAIAGLLRRKSIVVNEFGQFRCAANTDIASVNHSL